MLRLMTLTTLILATLSVPLAVGDTVQTPRYETYRTPKNPKKNWFVSHKKFTAAPFTQGDVSRFMFKNWSGPAIPVWTYVPSGIDVSDAPILIMLHGAKRNPARYLLEWAPLAQQNGFIVIAPEFSRKDFKGSRRYNRGNVSRRDNGQYYPVKESAWSFSAIEPLFDHAVQTLASSQSSYTLYGHSAGAQFVHRFLYYKPGARVKRYMIANSGWYTLPDANIEYPYGLRNSGVSLDTLKASLGKNVIILLGDQDNKMDSKSLNKSEGALAQGAHRYNRGVTFVKTAMEQSTALGVDFGWHIKRVRGVGHSNSGIAVEAAPFVR